jgi:hypothetical protein
MKPQYKYRVVHLKSSRWLCYMKQKKTKLRWNLKHCVITCSVPVCPHAGGVGLCEMVQHLQIFDYICLTGTTDGRMIEFTDQQHEHFENPVHIVRAHYIAPKVSLTPNHILGEWITHWMLQTECSAMLLQADSEPTVENLPATLHSLTPSQPNLFLYQARDLL